MSEPDRGLIIFPSDGPVRPGGNLARWVATGIVVFCAPMLCLVALAGLLSDGANLFERVVVGVINPVVGIAAAWTMLDESFWDRWAAKVAVAAAIALIGNLAAAFAIGIGWSSGDAEIPLILAMPFTAFVGYRTIVRLAFRRRLPD